MPRWARALAVVSVVGSLLIVLSRPMLVICPASDLQLGVENRMQQDVYTQPAAGHGV